MADIKIIKCGETEGRNAEERTSEKRMRKNNHGHSQYDIDMDMSNVNDNDRREFDKEMDNEKRDGGRKHVPPSLARVISQLSTLISELLPAIPDSKASDDPIPGPEPEAEPELELAWIAIESTVLADLLLDCNFASATSEPEDNPRL